MNTSQTMLKRVLMKRFREEMKQKKSGQEIFEIACNLLCNIVTEEQAEGLARELNLSAQR